MGSYVVTGASRGIGFEFLRQLSAKPDNTVIALVRDKAGTVKKVNQEIGRSNIHVVEGDLSNYDNLKNSVDVVSQITGGKLDYLIANAGFVSHWSGVEDVASLSETPDLLEKDLLDSFNINVVGQVHLFNLYTPLILQGRAKKVIALSTAMGDVDFVVNYNINEAPSYAISKAALNMVVAKFDAVYRKQGVLFMGVSPGVVDTSNGENIFDTEEKTKRFETFVGKIAKYAPHMKGPLTPEQSVGLMLPLFERATVETGYAGVLVSQHGNKQWM